MNRSGGVTDEDERAHVSGLHIKIDLECWVK